MRFLNRFAYCASVIALLAVPGAVAQEDDDRTLEKVTVTGSYIAGTPEDAALPVDVIGAEELAQIGAPSINEILRNLPAAGGLIGETNQFDTRGGQGNEGATTINLRGLGSARTLVLVNGRRHVAAEGLGVDVNIIPLTAIERAEVLKDGAAALYGSDAIGGVVNFITRDDFEGLELRGAHQFIQDSDGDTDLGALFGHAGQNWHFTIAAEYNTRGELGIKDRDWALRPYDENPQGGWSSIGNPGTYINAANGAFIADPNCDALGGSNQAGFCRFQYTYFDNLIEETETAKLFSTFSYDLGEQQLRLEAAYSEVDIAEWKTSPSYPPQELTGATNFVLADHPGRVAYAAADPDFAAATNDDLLIYWGRYAGVGGVNGGEAETGQRLINQYRASAGLSGPLFDNAVNYDLGVTYSSRNRKTGFTDMRVENFGFALRGLGGPDCDPATGTPGVGSCQYYNPFPNAIETSAVTGEANPLYDPAVANSDELLGWLTDTGFTNLKNELIVTDIVFSGDSKWSLPGGVVGYAVGAQARHEIYDLDISENFDLNANPCPFNDPASLALGFTGSLDCTGNETGNFAFLSGTFPARFERTVYGVFGEMALPVSDTIDVQLAGRFEDYGDNGGSTFDPKLAVRWQATDALAVRGSVSTTFRGPDQGALLGRFTSLEFITPTLAFKAVDVVGNPDLAPESALTTNLGLLFDRNGFSGSIDYWRFDLEDPFQTENATQIVNAWTAYGCENGGNASTSECVSLNRQVTSSNGTAAGITRIETSVINGANITTDGIDFLGQYQWDIGETEVTIGAQGTYTISYESDDFVNQDGIVLAEGGDFVGFLNEDTPFQTIVPLKANIFARSNRGPHSLSYTLRYTDDYEDVAPSIDALGKIDSQITHDVTYNLSLRDGRTRLSASVFNLTDEDPPQASTDLNYDPYTHNAFGRMIKLGVTQKF